MKRELARGALCLSLLYGLAACNDNDGGAKLSAAPAALSTDVTVSAEERAQIKALATGAVSNLVVHDEARPLRGSPFQTLDGKEVNLSALTGKVTLLNLWATWCAPCREEMPALARLSEAMAGDDFQVVLINLDRGGKAKATAFLKEVGADALPLYLDPNSKLAREMGALGLPVSAVLGRDAREIGRVTGPAHWDSDDAKAMLQAVIAATQD